jgi:PAS domain S-box-containing protein
VEAITSQGRQLDEVYPHLKMEGSAAVPTGTIAAPLEQLDLATVIKVSQAVSAEMFFERLLETMMRAAIEHAGAERALLILSGEADHRVAAEATSSNETVMVRLSDEPVNGSMLPETVLRYVLHTRESVVLDDAAILNPFSADSYIAQRHARSVLCVPLTNQAKLIGVLYFENNLAPRVFPPARIAVLKLLASQAAVSLDNARLYRDLDERERESRLIVNTIPGLVAALTPAGEVDVVNDQLVEYCGQPLEAMRQWGTNGTVHLEDLPRVAEVFTRGIASGEPYEVEGRVRRFDGVYRWFQIRGLPLRDTRGQVVRWYSLLSDVDDRKRAEVELRRAYDSFVDAQRLSKTGSFIADIVGDDNIFSEEAFRIFELDPATKVTVQRVREVIHPDDLAGWDAMIARAMSGADVTFAYRIVTTRGAVKHVRGIAHVREQMAGRPLFFGAVQDVTESVVAEEALNRARSELAHVTRVTTMGELTASIAHEVRQPIAAAVTSAQTALRWLEAKPPELGEVREALARIVRAGKQAGDVVGRIRALVTKAPPEKESVEINAAIREVVELTRGEAAKNRVSVRTVLAEGLPLIQGDRVQLQQVILNLIMNGIEAMTAGGEAPRELLISSRNDDAKCVLVAVADTGPGLASGPPEQVFAAFYTTKPGGLGLGLSICRSIIEAHDGRLWASANEPRGAVFQFTFPAPPR